MQKKKVVVMGGGNGTGVTIKALKRLPLDIDISAVISMCDSGGSTGEIRRYFDILPPSDIMRAVIAMSSYDEAMLKNIFYKNRISCLEKFNNDLQSKKGPNLGNLFLLLVEQYEGDFMRAVHALQEATKSVGEVYPSTLDKTNLVVELDNGEKVVGEGEIDEPKYDRKHRIKKAWLESEAQAYPDACKAIEEATCVAFGPGDLYTSVVASLLPKGIKEAINRSNARLSFVVGNAYHTEGETGPENLSEFVEELEQYLPRKLDVIIYNDAQLSEKQLQRYKEKGWSLIKDDREKIVDRKIISGDYEKAEGGLDPQKLSKIFLEIANSCKKEYGN